MKVERGVEGRWRKHAKINALGGKQRWSGGRRVLSRQEPKACIAQQFYRGEKRGVARDLQFNKFVVALSAPLPKVDRAPAVGSASDEARRDRNLIGPVCSTRRSASRRNRTLQHHLGAAVLGANLRLECPTPVLARAIFVRISITSQPIGRYGLVDRGSEIDVVREIKGVEGGLVADVCDTKRVGNVRLDAVQQG